MLGYLSLDIICSSKLTVVLELCSRKTVCFSEQIMSTVFSRQMKAIVYLLSEVKQNNFIVICLWQACRSIIICQSQRLRWNDKTIIIIVYHSISFSFDQLKISNHFLTGQGTVLPFSHKSFIQYYYA